MAHFDAIADSVESTNHLGNMNAQILDSSTRIFRNVNGIEINDTNLALMKKTVGKMTEKNKELSKWLAESQTATNERIHINTEITGLQTRITTINTALGGGLTKHQADVMKVEIKQLTGRLESMRDKLKEVNKRINDLDSAYDDIASRVGLQATMSNTIHEFNEIQRLAAGLKTDTKEISKDVYGLGERSTTGFQGEEGAIDDVYDDFFDGGVAPAGSVYTIRSVRPRNSRFTPEVRTVGTGRNARRHIVIPRARRFWKQMPDQLTFNMEVRVPTNTTPRRRATHTKKYTVKLHPGPEDKAIRKEDLKEKRNAPRTKRNMSRAAHAAAGALTVAKGGGIAAAVTGTSALYSVGSSFGAYKGIVKESMDKGWLGLIGHLPLNLLKRTKDFGMDVGSKLYNNTRRGATNFYGGGLKRLWKGDSFKDTIIPDGKQYLKTSFGR